MRTVRTQPKRFALIVVLLWLLAVTVPNGFADTAPVGARGAAGCSDLTLRLLAPTRVRFIVKKVSCSTAHRVMRTYEKTLNSRSGCINHGNRCVVDYPDGWTCRTYLTIEMQANGGIIAACGKTAGRYVGVKKAGGTSPGAALNLNQLLSPDHKVWCNMSAAPMFCSTADSNLSAELSDGGKLTLCHHVECSQQFYRSAPVLPRGSRSEVNGFRCESAANGITCTDIGTGKGFRINKSEAVRVG